MKMAKPQEVNYDSKLEMIFFQALFVFTFGN